MCHCGVLLYFGLFLLWQTHNRRIAISILLNPIKETILAGIVSLAFDDDVASRVKEKEKATTTTSGADASAGGGNNNDNNNHNNNDRRRGIIRRLSGAFFSLGRRRGFVCQSYHINYDLSPSSNFAQQ